jgi:predicted transposase YbfD/YdcC
LHRSIQFLFNHKAARLLSHKTTDKGHGRIEERTIDVALGLERHKPVPEFLDWPSVAQAFQLTRTTTRNGKTTTTVDYAVTSLTADELSAKQANALWRGRWTIENQLHWVRDVTFDEDRSQVRTGSAPQAMAAIRNIAIALLRISGCKSIAAQLRHNAAIPKQALILIGATH